VIVDIDILPGQGQYGFTPLLIQHGFPFVPAIHIGGIRHPCELTGIQPQRIIGVQQEQGIGQSDRDLVIIGKLVVIGMDDIIPQLTGPQILKTQAVVAHIEGKQVQVVKLWQWAFQRVMLGIKMLQVGQRNHGRG